MYNSRLLHHGGHLLRQCKATRVTGCVFAKYRQLQHEYPSRINHLQDTARLKIASHIVTDRGNEKEDYESSSQWKPVSPLVGVLGAAACALLLGGGSVLSEAPEDCSPDQNSAHTLNEDRKSQDEETGRDTVGRGRRAGEVPARSMHRDMRQMRQKLKIIAIGGKGGGRKHRHISDPTPLSHEEAVQKARRLLRQRIEEAGAPGIVVAVSVNGKTVWSDGLGYADLENNVWCNPDTVMRVASISKSLTMTAVARLWEEGKLDLDAPIQKYIPDFPLKIYEGEEVTITTRQLLSHKSGIRHYALKDPNKEEKEEKGESKNTDESKAVKKDREDTKATDKDREDKSTVTPKTEKDDKPTPGTTADTENVNSTEERRKELNEFIFTHANKRKKNNKKKEEEEEEDEFDLEEYYIKEEFETIKEALELFQKDDLFFKPGCGFLYTTHGWTLVSAVVEAVAGKPFTQVVTRLFRELGLDSTYLDKHDPIIYNRASYYVRDKRGKLRNAPYVDNSYKWAGGGFLSTVGDLCKFGNAMLYASQYTGAGGLPGYLKASTVQQLWTPVEGTDKNWQLDGGYGLGWQACKGGATRGYCRNPKSFAAHTGGAVGASSILLVMPKEVSKKGTRVSEGRGENEGVMSVGTECCKSSESSEAVVKIEGRIENSVREATVGASKENKVRGEARGQQPPKGVVVALITNMQDVGLQKVAAEIAQLFQQVHASKRG